MIFVIDFTLFNTPYDVDLYKKYSVVTVYSKDGPNNWPFEIEDLRMLLTLFFLKKKNRTKLLIYLGRRLGWRHYIPGIMTVVKTNQEADLTTGYWYPKCTARGWIMVFCLYACCCCWSNWNGGKVMTKPVPILHALWKWERKTNRWDDGQLTYFTSSRPNSIGVEVYIVGRLGQEPSNNPVMSSVFWRATPMRWSTRTASDARNLFFSSDLLLIGSNRPTVSLNSKNENNNRER